MERQKDLVYHIKKADFENKRFSHIQSVQSQKRPLGYSTQNFPVAQALKSKDFLAASITLAICFYAIGHDM